MFMFFSMIVVFLCLSPQVSGKVLEITDKNLVNVVRSNSKIPILFHNPSCPYSTSYHAKFVKTSNIEEK